MDRRVYEMDPYYGKVASTGSTTDLWSETLLPMFEVVVNLFQIRGEATMTIKRSLVTSVLLFGLAVVGVLSAHDESKHKGNATKGEIVAVADDSFVMKTAKGNVTVTLNKDTKIEHGEQAVDKTHLMKGEGVTVFGTKLPSGQLVAKEVVMGSAEAGGKPKTEHKH